MFEIRRATSTLNGKPLKLVDQFTYHGSNISTTESDVNIRLAKSWNQSDRLSIIQKSDSSDKTKKCGRVSTIVWMHYMNTNVTYGEKSREELHKNTMCYFEQILEARSCKTNSCTATYLSSHKASKEDKQDMLLTAREVRMNL